MHWIIVGVWWALFASLVAFRRQIEARMGSGTRTASKIAVLTTIAVATIASMWQLT